MRKPPLRIVRVLVDCVLLTAILSTREILAWVYLFLGAKCDMNLPSTSDGLRLSKSEDVRLTHAILGCILGFMSERGLNKSQIARNVGKIESCAGWVAGNETWGRYSTPQSP